MAFSSKFETHWQILLIKKWLMIFRRAKIMFIFEMMQLDFFIFVWCSVERVSIHVVFFFFFKRIQQRWSYWISKIEFNWKKNYKLQGRTFSEKWFRNTCSSLFLLKKSLNEKKWVFFYAEFIWKYLKNYNLKKIQRKFHYLIQIKI